MAINKRINYEKNIQLSGDFGTYTENIEQEIKEEMNNNHLELLLGNLNLET